MKKTLLAVAGLAAGLSFGGCLFVDHTHPHCTGDSCGAAPGTIEFFWAFELPDGSVTDFCDIAGVTRVDITVYDYSGYVEFEALNRPCPEAGGIIDNFNPGDYDINLVGVCGTGAVTHEGWWSVFVESGRNDYGTLVLDRLGNCY